MGSLSYIIFIIVVTVTLFSSCAATGAERPKRILLDDNYYTIINELHNLSKAVETLTSENARLSQQVQDIKAVKGLRTV
jgi:outer membrane murein-binding lipoprotein Lpp